MKPKAHESIRTKELILEDAEGNERASLRTHGDGTAMLEFKDSGGNMRLRAGIQDSQPQVGMFFAGGKGAIELEANDPLNCAGLVITGPGGKVQAVLGITSQGIPAIALFDEKGKLLFPTQTPGNIEQEQKYHFDWDKLLRM